MKSFADIIMAIIFLALAATLVTHPGTISVINAGSNAFTSSLKVATQA